MDEKLYSEWESDAALLAAIGRALFTQDTTITVRLPADLADAALAAWEREDPEEPVLRGESAFRRTSRHRSGALGLIGLSVQNRSTLDGYTVVVELDAWNVGSALDAADDGGLLDGLLPPDRRS